MAAVYGTLDQPLEQASSEILRVAASQGWTFVEEQSSTGMLVFKKGISAFSWGSAIWVQLEASSPSQTRLSISTAERAAITDWGRGKRAAHRLLAVLGARKD